MKKIYFNSDEEFQNFIKNGKDLGEKKTFLVHDKVIKIFNIRGLLSSGFIHSYSNRIISNSAKLNQNGINSLNITHQLEFIHNKRLSGVIYNHIPGIPIRDMSIKEFTKSFLKELALFLSSIHSKGIYFRAMHMGNIIYHNGNFCLIDVAKVHFYPWSLMSFTRARAYRRFIKYPKDLKKLGKNNLELLIKMYMEESKFNLLNKLIFKCILKILMNHNYKLIKRYTLFFAILFLIIWLI